MMTRFKTLLLLFSAMVLAYAGLQDMSEAEASASFECIAHIVCDLMEGEVLKNIYNEAGPEARSNGVLWLGQAYKMTSEQIEDHDVFWRDYSDVVCVYTKDKRREAFKTFMIKFAKYFTEICERVDEPEECEGANKGMAAGMEIIQNYTAHGECNDPKKAAEGMAQAGKSKIPGGFPG